MKMDDYMEYYIQGSDHYLIPKDIFDELFNEMTNWKEKCMELEKQNFNLREYIVVNKMAIPYEEIKDKSLYDLYTIPSYSDLSKENQKYKEVINKIKEVCNSIPITHSICGIEKIHDIENILKEVE